VIYATVGTMYLDFPRLIRAMDAIAKDTGERVVIQRGMGRTVPAHCEHFDFKPREEVQALQAEARLIVCHGGIGSVIDALQAGRPLLVVPRLRRFGEHNNDHQLDLAVAVERRGWGRAVLNVADLPRHCAVPPPAKGNYQPDSERLLAFVRASVHEGMRGPQ
jgi:beta-1,4-N-acetylglucosaminyltransferase